MNFWKSKPLTYAQPPLMMPSKFDPSSGTVVISDPTTFGIEKEQYSVSAMSAGAGAVDAIITDQAMEGIADKVFDKIKQFIGQHDLTTAKFSDELSVIKMEANLGQAFATIAGHSLGAKSIVISNSKTFHEFMETTIQLTLVTDPEDKMAVQSIASLVSWAASHGMVV